MYSFVNIFTQIDMHEENDALDFKKQNQLHILVLQPHLQLQVKQMEPQEEKRMQSNSKKYKQNMVSCYSFHEKKKNRVIPSL